MYERIFGIFHAGVDKIWGEKYAFLNLKNR